MTFKLIFENLRHRPLRSLLSVFLIGIGVTLILALVGLSQGMLAETERRTRGVGADILLKPPGAALLSFSGAPLPQKLADALATYPHVTMATGTIIQSLGGGISSVTGVDLDAFNRMSGGFKYLEGGPFQTHDDILVDQYYARQHKVHAGGTVNVLNHDWRVAGVVEAGKLARIILPLGVVQELTGNRSKVSQVFLKVDSPENIAVVIADLKAKLEGYSIYSMEEFTSLVSIDNIPALRPFINVMIAITVVVAFAVVCLSMYMAVLQRTREIGILKSLGASRTYILQLIVAEAVIMGLGGTLIGIVLSFVSRWLITTLVPASLTQAIVVEWWPKAAAIALTAALLGSLYPGWSAARQDAIEALAYE
jgi:putative ABC transport system permease protein